MRADKTVTGIKKARHWPGFLFSSAELLLSGFYRRANRFAGFFAAFPAGDLNPLAGFEVFVVLEEVLDLVQ